MASEPPVGFMIHGFSKNEAEHLQQFMEVLANQKVISISATGMEDQRVAQILDAARFDNFAAADPKILMFLGFQDNMIGAAMNHFPPDLGRPIFCSPTEQNLQWTFEYLVEHLLEEREAMKKRKLD